MIKTVTVNKFRGLNNKQDRAALSNEWQETADNVDIDDAQKIRRAPGTTSYLSGVADIYHMRFRGLMYAVKTDGTLLEITASANTEIASGVGDGPYCWAELGVNTYLSWADGGYEIRPDGVYPWGIPAPSGPQASTDSGPCEYGVALTFLRSDGIESPASTAYVWGEESAEISIESVPTHPDCQTCIYVTPPDGARFYLAAKTAGGTQTITAANDGFPLATLNKAPPLYGRPVAGFDGALWLGIYDDAQDITRLFHSLDNPYLYRYSDPGYDLPGRVLFQAPARNALVVGTSRAVFAIAPADDGNYSAIMLTEYPAVESSYGWDEYGVLYFATTHGLCKYPDFQPLTDGMYAIPFAGECPLLIADRRGFRQCLVSVPTNGIRHNPYGDRLTPTEI